MAPASCVFEFRGQARGTCAVAGCAAGAGYWGGKGRCDDLRAAETPGSPCIRAFAPGRAASRGRLHLREAEGVCVSCRSLRALAVIIIGG